MNQGIGQESFSIFDTYFEAMTRHHGTNGTDRTTGTDGKSGHTSSRLEIVGTDWTILREREVRCISESAMVELSFCFEGCGQVEVSGGVHDLQEGSCSLQLMRDFSASFRYEQGTRVKTLALGMPVWLFNAYHSSVSAAAASPFDRLLGTGSFRQFRCPILPVTRGLLQELEDCPYTGAMKDMYLEAKALELFAVYTNRFLYEKDSQAPVSGTLSRTDRQKIREAREEIIRRMDAPPSLLELSRIVGINDYKLKLGFKELYGTSVFAYLREQRLHKAGELLRKGDMSVSEAAARVGYMNFSHFAEAFRRRFGVNPSVYRKEPR
ncbi:helix-turn-helix transcriptional regulator [Paenibacillus chitinolyticus]|uniref:helix-turn-helix transcriptional regulator n=1 Tax=Paenibacillus chitinolyticus TaxID=79263 RepID=UPI0035591752